MRLTVSAPLFETAKHFRTTPTSRSPDATSHRRWYDRQEVAQTEESAETEAESYEAEAEDWHRIEVSVVNAQWSLSRA
jgi:hypothetical protein